jgi:hypothetical protein
MPHEAQSNAKRRVKRRQNDLIGGVDLIRGRRNSAQIGK